MAQHDYSVDNGTGAAVRSDINALSEAIATLNAGATAPSVTFAYMLWADTTSGILKQRNAANNAWINILTMSTGAVLALTTLIDAIDGLTPAAGSFIRFASSTTAVMQAIIGTVSQSGGVATGAIIEQGSNANGDYIRFASGWQICISPHIVTTPTGVTAIEGSTWTYPAAFASFITSFAGAPGSASATSGAGTTRDMGVWAPASVTTTSLTPRFLGSGGWTVNAANTLTFAFIAIGKWF